MQNFRAVCRLSILLIGWLWMAACAIPAPSTAPASAVEAPTPIASSSIDALTANLTDGCVDVYDPTVDYFPEKVSVEYANFEVQYFNNYKLVTVNDPWLGADQSYQYLLVQCGTPVPEDHPDLPVIEIPVDSVIALSTTYLPQLENLGLVDRLVGIDSTLWTTTESVRERIAAGDVVEVGSGSTVNVEAVLDLEPGLIMAYSIGMREYDTHPVLEEVGMPVVLNGDFVEQDPLGRTEWIKFMAIFFNQEREAQSQFAQIVEEYNEVAALAASVDARPTVFVSSIYNGTWWMAGSDSYMVRLLADAGADYLWADTGTVGSEPVAFETVLDRAFDADYWINPDNSFWFTVEDVLASDERYAEFAALQAGNLYNNNAIVNENGGNAFYESGAANPHIILKDLVKIFHPDLLPEHELVYYRQVE
ncbi:MAG: ABC transporter substrate-binding protein [Caldilineaceae bacterium]|nr:ABC transporter substrate-binding protein [Caldilineaceae bacterium]